MLMCSLVIASTCIHLDLSSFEQYTDPWTDDGRLTSRGGTVTGVPAPTIHVRQITRRARRQLAACGTFLVGATDRCLEISRPILPRVAFAATRLLYDGHKSIDRRITVRKTDPQRIQDIWQAVEQQPGVLPARVAQQLGIHRSSVTRALPALEQAGKLLSEDGQGRLWPWKNSTDG